MTLSPPIAPKTPDGYLCTARLLANLYHICAVLAGGIACSKAVLQLSCHARALSQVIFKAQQHNARLGLKTAMLRDGNWRARVMEDLGGAAHMARWEGRYSAAQFRVMRAAQAALPASNQGKPALRPAPERSAFAARPSHPLCEQDKVRTDFNGQFRLAPIPRRSGPRLKELGLKELGRKELGLKALGLKGSGRSALAADFACMSARPYGQEAQYGRPRAARLDPICLLGRELLGGACRTPPAVKRAYYKKRHALKGALRGGVKGALKPPALPPNAQGGIHAPP